MSPLSLPLAFLDTETTGTNSQNDRIIEIAVIRVENNHVVKTFQTLINPQTSLSPFITQITGIQAADLFRSPTFSQIKPQLDKILSNCCLVAHNARFDYSFLRSEYHRLGEEFTYPHLCTVRLSRLLFPEFRHHNLDSIINRFHLNCSSRHRALGDTEVIFDFFQNILRSFPLNQVENIIHKLITRPSLPPHLDPSLLINLPQSPGVYIFKDDENIPIYIGKSKNLRSRIHSHFYDSLNSPKEMAISQKLHSIDTIATAGELSALLLESSLVKRMLPLYNRKLRHNHQLQLLTAAENPQGYYTISLQPSSYFTPENIDSILAVFRTKKQAIAALSFIADEYHLCPKLLGLEKAARSCFSYHLGKCRGACINKEATALYNLRFTTAFISTRFKPWPYPTPILITETDESNGFSQSHLIHQWLHLGTYDNFDPNSDLPHINTIPSTIDLDDYKILKSFFSHPTPNSTIIPIPYLSKFFT